MSSPLDRIEADANKSRGSSNAPYVRREDVLALVNVAKAAEKTGWRDADGLCWCEKSTEITKAPHRPQCLRMREALAVLNQEPDRRSPA